MPTLALSVQGMPGLDGKASAGSEASSSSGLGVSADSLDGLTGEVESKALRDLMHVYRTSSNRKLRLPSILSTARPRTCVVWKRSETT